MTTTDGNGIVFLEMSDNISPFPALINGLQQGTSDAVGSLITDVNNLKTRLPRAIASGIVTFPAGTYLPRNLNLAVQQTITFPPGLFTTSPQVTCNLASGAGGSQQLFPRVNNPSTASAAVYMINMSDSINATVSSALPVHWIAVQQD